MGEKMNINQLRTKKENEKEAYIMMKNYIKKPTILKAGDFKPGQIIMFSYAAKYDKNPYDASPVSYHYEVSKPRYLVYVQG